MYLPSSLDRFSNNVVSASRNTITKKTGGYSGCTGPIRKMSETTMHIDAKEKPETFPSPESIIQQCIDGMWARRGKENQNLSGVPIVDEFGDTCVWAKSGIRREVAMAEARTQQYVAQKVNSDPDAPVRVPNVYLFFESRGWGYILMEFIDGELCDFADAPQVAIAVQYLITIKCPTEMPGPVMGGPICHDLFIDRESSVVYESVELLEMHINGVSARLYSPQIMLIRNCRY